MEQETFCLEIKPGWKAYQLIAGPIAIGGMIYMLIQLIGIAEYAEGGALFLGAFFLLASAAMLYSMAYAFRHRIIFGSDGLKRKGVFGEKAISYSDISSISFSDSYWNLRPTGRIPGDAKALLIDYKYRNHHEAAEFLENTLSREHNIDITKDD